MGEVAPKTEIRLPDFCYLIRGKIFDNLYKYYRIIGYCISLYLSQSYPGFNCRVGIPNFWVFVNLSDDITSGIPRERVVSGFSFGISMIVA
jgi:hypothetical protein